MNTNKKTLEDAIKHVVNYYAYFKYAPSFDELFTYLPLKTTKKDLDNSLSTLVERGVINSFKLKNKNSPSYTLPPYRIYATQKESKKEASEHKIRSISLYLRAVYLIAPVMLIGLSGSIAMLDADSQDDIDLFIIAQHDRMWTVRLWCLFLATMFGLRRKRGVRNAPNKVCLNLFYDERELIVPNSKQNEYTAHEVLQMKPVYEKNNMYAKFLKANSWVGKYFPNFHPLSLRAKPRLTWRSAAIPTLQWIRDCFSRLSGIAMTVGDIFETMAKTLQLAIIKRHQTTEIITPTQLWFFPRDFEKRLREKSII